MKTYRHLATLVQILNSAVCILFKEKHKSIYFLPPFLLVRLGF